MTSDAVVVVGGSYAGLNAAAAVRNAGHVGSIVLLGEEPHLPYQRPPLSKEYLKGKVPVGQLSIRSEKFLEDNRIEFRPGQRAAALDRDSRAVILESGESLGYAKLVLATGCVPRRLDVPGAVSSGIHYLRTLDDAMRVFAEIEQARSVAVVGGGFIGLEIGASLRALGKAVTVIEAQSRLLARAMPEVLSSYIAARHAREGVRLIFGAQVARFQTDHGRVKAVQVSNGDLIEADLVIVGVGVLPSIELAQASGITCANGIVVDDSARTSDPDIYAAGDCTSHPSAFARAMVRLECVQNAVDQGRVAGTNAGGGNARYATPPWFWSDQYDLKIQGVGWSSGFDRYVLRGTMESGAFSIFYFDGPDLLAVESINKPADHMVARKLIAARARVTDTLAGDPAYDLRKLLAA